jgi:TP901 family phage tail tape measure protein
MSTDVGTATLPIKPELDSSGLSSVEKDMSGRLGKMASGWKSTFAGVFTGQLVSNAAAGALSMFADGMNEMDGALDAIASKSGLSGKALDQLTSSFKKVAGSGPQSLQQSADAVTGLQQRLGLTGAPLEKLSKQMLDLSRVTGTDLNKNVADLTRFLGDAGVPAGEMTGALDKLFRASQVSGVSFDKLAESATKFGGPMRQLGFSTDESVALLAKFNKEGVNTDLVMGSLRIGLGKAAKQGKDARVALDDTFAAIRNAKTPTEATTAAIKMFGSKAGPDMAAAVREGRFQVDDLLKSMNTGTATISGTAAATDDWQQKLSTLKNKALTGLEPLFTGTMNALTAGITKAIPAVTALVTWIGDRLRPVFDDIGSWITSNWPKISATITKGLDVARSAVETFVAVVSAIWDRWGDTILRIVDLVWTNVQAQISAALRVLQGLINTVMGVITGDWSRAWDGIRDVFGGMWDSIRSTLSTVLGVITAIVSQQLRDLGSLFSNAVSAIGSTMSGLASSIAGRVGDLWNVLRNTADRLVDGFLDAARSSWNAVTGWLASLGTLISGAAVSLAGALVDDGAALINRFLGAARGAWSSVTGWAGGLVVSAAGLAGSLADDGVRLINGFLSSAQATWGGVVHWLGTLASGVSNAFGSAFDAMVKTPLNAIIRAWNNFQLTIGGWTINMPSPIPDIHVPTITVAFPNIPYLARGAIIDNAQLAVFGEAGPEAAVPLSARRVSDFRKIVTDPRFQDQLSRAFPTGTQAARAINIVNNGHTSVELDERELVRVMRRAELLAGVA